MTSLLRHSLTLATHIFHIFDRAYDYFRDVVLPVGDDADLINQSRKHGYFSSAKEDILKQYLVDNEDAISYFGNTVFARNALEIVVAPIRNSDGIFITPTTTSIDDGSYNPLSRRIYMNLRTCSVICFEI